MNVTTETPTRCLVLAARISTVSARVSDTALSRTCIATTVPKPQIVMTFASTTRCVEDAIPYTTHKIDPLTF